MISKGAEILVEALLREKVEVIFGIPGGAVIPVYDALYDSPIRQILCRHEQGAAHAADGYARASGKVGVCLVTSGPGATNLTTGIATANFDSSPTVFFTGQVKTNLIGNDAFQEADITGITRPITKHSYLVKDVKDLARIVKEAFHIASTGRPGPVLIDLPVDVSISKCEANFPGEANIRGYHPNYKGHPKQIRLAAEAINKSERPVVYAGGGIIISGASEELKAFVEKGNLPITTTLLGLGAFPEDHSLSLKMLGMHGTVYANYTVMNSDLIVAIGARFDDRITGKVSAFAPKARIIHIDIDPASISKNIQVHIPVVGDARFILKEMLPLIETRERKEWHNQIKSWKEQYRLTYNRDKGFPPQLVVEEIGKITRGEAIICTEVGQNQMWAAQWYGFKKPRTIITSGGLGTMGFGFPASIGAKVARPDALVIDIAGDGSIQMNIQELATAVHNKISVKVCILNNGYLGMVRQWQELFYDKRYAMTQLSGNPDFVKLAEAYGAYGIRVEHPDQVHDALIDAFNRDETVFLDFKIDPEADVFPMVPAGEALDRMIGRMA